MADDLFERLSDKAGFCEFVTQQLLEGPKQITAIMACAHVVAGDRVEFAFNAYSQAISKFSLYLHSKNPDHYKRAGALLYGLNSAAVITQVDMESTSEELEAGYTRVTLGDAEHKLPFVQFYETYFNQAASFEIAYRCCAAYEEHPTEYDFDYLHNVCRYMKNERGVSLDDCFILFKSLML